MPRRFAYVLLAIIIILATAYRCYWNIGKSPVERWDEKTNIAVVDSSLKRRTFPVLIYEGSPFFEKPPLWYYLGLVAGSVRQVDAHTMRAVSATAGFVLILTTVWVAWKWWGTISGLSAWAVLLTTQHLFVSNAGGFFSTHTLRSADADSIHIFFLFLSFVLLTYVRRSRFAARLAGASAGFSFLAKGPFGLLPLVLVTLYMLVTTKKEIRGNILQAWCALILVCLPWYVFMTVWFGLPFLSEHFIYHVATRSLMPIEGHNNPSWYYVQLLGNRNVFLFGKVLVVAIVWTIVHAKLDKRALFAAIITLVYFLLPTIVQTRLAWYILPMYPFAALTIGAAVYSWLQMLKSRA